MTSLARETKLKDGKQENTITINLKQSGKQIWKTKHVEANIHSINLQ